MRNYRGQRPSGPQQYRCAAPSGQAPAGHPLVRPGAQLAPTLANLEGAGYGAYKSLSRKWDFPAGENGAKAAFELRFDRIQADPYAPPSAVAVVFDPAALDLPADLLATAPARLALADFLVRRLAAALAERGERNLRLPPLGPQILERSYARLSPTQVEIRLGVELPARGRRIMGGAARRLLCEVLPQVLSHSLWPTPATPARRHVECYLDFLAARQALAERGLVAFVANNSVLPRTSGVSQAPLPAAVPFVSPPGLEVDLELPFAGRVTGLGIKPGITLIVGGGFHGKSTLLQALERGVYAHIPGDGRELVVTNPSAVKIRAEEGRAVVGVDISPFIGQLPGGRQTTRFFTENASGSTSQAAALMEALEAGAQLLLIDEDTSATNLLIRDRRMQALVEAEPITPLRQRIEALSRGGVSTVMVMGGSGEYLEVADTVIMMRDYQASDVTERAREIAGQSASGTEMAGPVRLEGEETAFPAPNLRLPLPAPATDLRGRKVKARRLNEVTVGRSEIDLSAVDQVVDPGQTLALGRAVDYLLQKVFDGTTELSVGLAELEDLLDRGGLDILQSRATHLVRPRPQEIAAALSRLRSLELAGV